MRKDDLRRLWAAVGMGQNEQEQLDDTDQGQGTEDEKSDLNSVAHNNTPFRLAARLQSSFFLTRKEAPNRAAMTTI